MKAVTIHLSDAEYAQLVEIARRDNEFARKNLGDVVIESTPEIVATGAVVLFLSTWRRREQESNEP
jgi:hypothetical protein